METERFNIVLTGFMGTGKSTVGRLLARRLGYRWIDTDALIEQHHGPIDEIFRTEGEAAFRAHERAVVESIGNDEGLVISTGGRLMLDPTNVATLEDAVVFCLTARVDTIVARTEAESVARPLLGGDDRTARVTALLAERTPMYQRFEPISTDDRSPDEVVEEIVGRFDERRSSARL